MLHGYNINYYPSETHDFTCYAARNDVKCEIESALPVDKIVGRRLRPLRGFPLDGNSTAFKKDKKGPKGQFAKTHKSMNV